MFVPYSHAVQAKKNSGNVTLSVEADEKLLPLLTAFVENAALCFGLGRDESLKLTLAAEEVFVHLCRVVMPAGGALEIRCSNGGYRTQAVFVLPGTEAFDLKAFNLTAAISTEDDASLDEMGLVIASRSVDRFSLSRETGRDLQLALIKEKSYPMLPEAPPATVNPLDEWTLRQPTVEEVKYVCSLSSSYYGPSVLHNIFTYPGKLADMMSVGEYHALAAVGSRDEIGGSIFWRWTGERVIECLGPYVFNQGPQSEIPRDLLEGCIGAIAKTQAVGIVNTLPTPEFSRRDFEFLGTVESSAQNGNTVVAEAWFRLLHEDTGAVVWVHPELEDFVRQEYSRLVLPREVRVDRPSGEAMTGHSVLSAEFDRPQRRVKLRPMWPGADAEENIGRHVRLLKQEGISDTQFDLDLGEAWQTVFVPGLLKSGFAPRFVLPYAGQGDVVTFQLRREEA